MSEDKKKNGIGKTVQKGFYKVFNDKSPVRRIAFSAALVVAPTMVVSNLYTKDVSLKEPPGAAQRVADYNKEIEALAKDVPSTVLTFKKSSDQQQPKLTMQETEKLTEVSQHAKDFSSKLLWDKNISEKDARDIAKKFNNTLGDVTHTPTMKEIEGYAQYLDEARADLAKKPGVHNDQEIKKEIISAYAWDVGLSGVLGWFVFFEIFDGWLKRGLRHGRKRDDENIFEEKVEKFEEAKNDLQDILKPKGPVTPPRR